MTYEILNPHRNVLYRVAFPEAPALSDGGMAFDASYCGRSVEETR